MDDKKKNIRPVKAPEDSSANDDYGSGYDWESFDRRTSADDGTEHEITAEEKNENIRLLKKSSSSKHRENKVDRSERNMHIFRYTMLFLIFVCLLLIFMFMTPVFNIKKISVEGNNVVTLEEIDAKIGDLMGENLFRTGTTAVSERLSSIAYIDTVSVSRKIFPPTVNVKVTEYKPAAQIKIDGKSIVINSALKVLDDRGAIKSENIPQIDGVSTQTYTIGKQLQCDNDDQKEILTTFLTVTDKIGILNDIESISAGDLSDVEFRYQNRINVLCGTKTELERKLRLFRETIISKNIAGNAKGTIDLSVVGKAVYTP